LSGERFLLEIATPTKGTTRRIVAALVVFNAGAIAKMLVLRAAVRGREIVRWMNVTFLKNIDISLYF